MTARDLSRGRELVGYVALILRPHPHYKDVIVAVDDLHYLMPRHRGLGNGGAMLDFAEKAAFKAGARLFSFRDKANAPHAKMWEDRGYTLSDLVYIKDLTNAAAPHSD